MKVVWRGVRVSYNITTHLLTYSPTHLPTQPAPLCSKQVRTIRGLVARHPDVLGSIPLTDDDLMAATLHEKFKIKSMTMAMMLTLSSEEQEQAVEKAKAQKAAAKAKKIAEHQQRADAAVAETAGRGLGESQLRVRAKKSYAEEEGSEGEECEKEMKKPRKGPSEYEKLKARNAELEEQVEKLKQRVAELEAQVSASSAASGGSL